MNEIEILSAFHDDVKTTVPLDKLIRTLHFRRISFREKKFKLPDFLLFFFQRYIYPSLNCAISVSLKELVGWKFKSQNPIKES